MRTKKTASVFLSVTLIICCAALLFLVIRRAATEAAEPQPTVAISQTGAPAASPEERADEFATLRLAVAGDLIAHDDILSEARRPDGFDFRPLMEAAQGVTARADIAAVCFEGAFTKSGHSGFPMFKSPDSLAKALADTGFTLVSTASNHALDGLGPGLLHTLDALDENGLAHVGTYRSYDEWERGAGITLIEKNGISIAFLAYTYGTNGISIPDVGGHAKAVNVFMRDYLSLTAGDVDYDRLRSDLSAARELGADLIAVFMHWGTEYQIRPGSIQTNLTEYLIGEGVDLILGGHPHVPQPMELRAVPDGHGGERRVFISYCMGNFLSSMNDENTKLTGIAEIEIKKNLTTGEASVESASYVPFYMADLSDFGASAPDWRYRLLDLHTEIDAYEEKLLAGRDTSPVNDAMYQDMLLGLESLHEIFGREYDSRTANP